MDNAAAYILIIFAGILNGSFALPIKHINRSNKKDIFLIYALLSFVILPWLLAWCIEPQLFSIYAVASKKVLGIMLIGGFIFGIGQVCFLMALNFIGLSLGFIINLGFAIFLGSLLPYIFIDHHDIFSTCGLLTVLGSFIAAAGLLFSHRAGILHNKIRERGNTKFFKIGVMLAILAGISSAGQNCSFVLTSAIQATALNMGATPFSSVNIMWPGFLGCSFIPYASYMLYLKIEHHSPQNYINSKSPRYFLFALFMATFWYGSLLFYSKATQIIGVLGPIIGWPLFMILILMTATFWGWHYREWEGASHKVKRFLWSGLGLLMLAMILLGLCSTYT
jgi:L-rhamnose-H+ transport protein